MNLVANVITSLALPVVWLFLLIDMERKRRQARKVVAELLREQRMFLEMDQVRIMFGDRETEMIVAVGFPRPVAPGDSPTPMVGLMKHAAEGFPTVEEARHYRERAAEALSG